MQRGAPVLPALLAAVLLVPTTVSAQTRLFFGAGMTAPMGDYGSTSDESGDGAQTGWMANLGLGFGLKNPRLGVSIAGFYGSNSHDDAFDPGGSTNLYGFLAHLRYALHDAGKTGLFLAGGGGMQVHSYSNDDAGYSDDGSEWKPVGSLAAGVDIPLKKLGLYLVGGYILGDTSYLRFMAGLSIPLGGEQVTSTVGQSDRRTDRSRTSSSVSP